MIIKNQSRMFDFITKTWNPIAMRCPHKCYGGKCWSEMLKDGKLKDAPRYQNLRVDNPVLLGKELKKRFNENDFVFVEDMGDLFAATIPDIYIQEVFKVIKQSSAMFLLLTKNPERMLKFWRDYPKNVMLGITIETDKDYPHLSYAPPAPARLYWASHVSSCMEWDADKRGIKLFISIEPILYFTDHFPTMLYWLHKSLWGVAIGYDNYKAELPEPELEKTQWLIEKLDEFVPKIYVKSMREKHEST